MDEIASRLLPLRAMIASDRRSEVGGAFSLTYTELTLVLLVSCQMNLGGEKSSNVLQRPRDDSIDSVD